MQNLQKMYFSRNINVQVISILSSIKENVEILSSTTGWNGQVHPIDGKCVASGRLLHKFYNEWKSFYLQSQHLKNTSPDDANIDKEIIENLKLKGKTLSSILFGDSSRQIIFPNDSVIVFSVDPEYANLPFEILIQNDRFLCEQSHIIKQIRDRRLKPSIEKKKSKDFLFIFNPSNDIETLVEAERSTLKNLFDKTSFFSSLKIIDPRYVQESQIIEELHNAKYVHYAGHTKSDKIALFNGQELDISDISNLDLCHIEILFFNSCYSSSQKFSSSSIVQSFIKAGVKNFIGYNLPVSNHIALFVSEKFWKGFLQKQDLLENIAEIRKSVREKFGDGELSWVILNLFGTLEPKKKKHKLLFPKVLWVVGIIMILSGLIYMIKIGPFSVDSKSGIVKSKDNSSRIVSTSNEASENLTSNPFIPAFKQATIKVLWAAKRNDESIFDFAECSEQALNFNQQLFDNCQKKFGEKRCMESYKAGVLHANKIKKYKFENALWFEFLIINKSIDRSSIEIFLKNVGWHKVEVLDNDVVRFSMYQDNMRLIPVLMDIIQNASVLVKFKNHNKIEYRKLHFSKIDKKEMGYYEFDELHRVDGGGLFVGIQSNKKNDDGPHHLDMWCQKEGYLYYWESISIDNTDLNKIQSAEKNKVVRLLKSLL